MTLAWTAAAEWVRLTPLDSQGRLTNVSISLPISGTLVVTPEAGGNSQGYILFAASGDTSTSAAVTVRLRCQAEWFFPNPPSVCPLSAPHAAAMAAQPFEHGLMLWADQWTSGGPAILALINGGVSGRGEWQEWPDQWVAGMPESDPTLTPPPGLFEPRRGFGKLWREQVALRDKLGWATAPEAALPGGLWQWDALAKYNSVYITGPGGLVYVLGPEHASWAVWTGATATP